MLRALSKQLKKDDVQPSHFACAVRVVNRLEKLGMTVEDIDSAVELMYAHCFKTGKTVNEFLIKVEEVSNVANSLRVTLYSLSEYIKKQLDKKSGLESEIASLNDKLSEEWTKYNITIRDLEEYRKNKTLLARIEDLKVRLNEREQALETLKFKFQEYRKLGESMDAGMRSYVKKEIEKFNQEFNKSKPLDIVEFEYLIGEVHYSPCEYPKVIQFMRDNIPLPKEGV